MTEQELRKKLEDVIVGYAEANRKSLDTSLNDGVQFITQYATQCRIDELKPVSFRVKDALKASSGPSVVVRTHLTDEFIDKRIAQLKKELEDE